MRHRLGQRRSDSPLKALPRRLVLAFAACIGSTALALPVGPQLVAGSAAIAQAGNALTVANSPGAILNWQTFNIGANERVRFEQTSASSAVLNRVLANDPSVILGQLSSNGSVWLVNPAGILVGPGARIDTAAFVASTLNITNADFLANKLKFDGLGGAGNVVNQGTITTPLGGSVYLIGSQVSNDGIITTPKGETILAAGQKVELIDTATPGVKVEITGQEGNVTNLGQITAEAGRIGIVGALIKNAGTLNASSVESEGGRIFLRATRKIELTETSKVGADGTAGGNVTAVVSENGKISGELTANGEISAQGNGTSGSGGFVETSASHLSIGDGFKVATRGGHWLLDPVDFVIAATGGNITGTALSTLLGSNSITIQTATGTDTATHRYGTTGSNGDIFVNDTVAWSANKLTLNAHRNIAITTAMNGSGTASLALEYGQGAVAASNTATYTINAPVNLPAGNNFSTKLGSDGTTTTYTVIASLSGLQNISSGLSGSYALGSDISGSAFTSVGNKTTPFNGTFAGLGHKISALSITPNSDYAGLFGATGTTSIIRDVTLDGTVISAGNYIGDLVGFNAGAISNAHTRGSTSRSGTNYIGGLVGFNTGAIDYCSNTSTNPVSAGGKSFVGGLVGANYGDIRNSYNSGSVSAGGATSGGGIAGINAGKISYSYSSGSVINSGGGKIGGVVGINNGTIEHSYWDTQTSTQTACAGAGSSSGCAGKTTAEMQTQATYSGWDFTTIWAISSGHYPTLSLRQTAPSAQVTTSDVNLWTGGGNDSLWTTASNWSLNHTPTSSENVYVPSSVAFTFGAGNIAIKSLICDSNFTLDGRTLSLGSSSTLSAITLNASSARLVLNGVTSIGSLTLSSGEISGTGSLNVTASFNKTGGTIANTLTGLSITQANGNLSPGDLAIAGPIVLNAQNGQITLGNLSSTNNRWLVYAADPAKVTKNGVTSNFRQYNTIYGGVINGTGNGFIYASAPGTLTVTPTLTGGSAGHIYGNTPSATFGYTLTGFADSEDNAGNIGVSAGTFSFTPTNTTAFGNYTRDYLSGMVSTSGYSFTAGTGLAYSVAKRSLTITADAKTMIYGNSVPSLTYTVGGLGLVNDDTLAGALATTASTTSDVGSYAITQGSLAASSNYNLAYAGNNVTIDKRSLSIVTINPATKTYDGNTNVTVLPAPTFANALANDLTNLGITGSGNYADRHVGSGKNVSYSTLSLTGSAANNYRLTSDATSGTGSITQRPTVTWTGAAGDGKWSTAGNWADNALPDYDPTSTLDNVGRILLNSGGTPLRITDTQAVRLRQTSLDVSGAGLDLDVIGGIFTGSGKLLASEGSLKLTAHSPIVIGSGGLEASQGISLLATTPEGASTILINGPLTSTSGPITLSAYNNIILNASLTGTTIQRSSQIGSIQVAAGVTVSEVPAANSLSPGEQVAQVVVTNLATATHAATVTAVENSSTSGSSVNLPLIPSLLLPSLTQTIGGEEGQFGSVASTTDTPAATTEKTAQADANPATNTAHKKVAQCS